MPRTRHFKTVYKNESIKVAGNSPAFTITWPDGKTVVIERYADGWYMPKSLEQHWTDADIAGLGALIEQRIKSV